VLAVVGSLVTPTGRVAGAARAAAAPVLATGLVCPAGSGGPTGRTSATTVSHVTRGRAPAATYTPVTSTGGARPAAPLKLDPSTVLGKDTPYGAVAVNAQGVGSDGVVADQSALIPSGVARGLYDLTCLPPATDWWFADSTGYVGIDDLLFIVNPADAPANVALSLWSTRGPLSPPGTSGIVVPPHTTIVRRVSNFAPDVTRVGLRVHANSGTVAAAVLDRESRGDQPTGSDWMPPTLPPTTASVVTGFMPGATYHGLDLLNPGDRDATVSLRILTPTKNFVPAGHQTVVVPAGDALGVDLSGAIAGEAAAVVLSSDAPVSASGLTAQAHTGQSQELAWLPAQQALTGPAGIAANVPPFGQNVSLVLTAPEGRATVRVTTPAGANAVVTVPAGRTINVDLKALLHAGAGGPGPLLLTPLDAPVYAVRTLYAVGAHGPLMAASAPLSLPQPTALPPVVPDPRAALP